MKKFVLVVFFLLIFTCGCESMMNTPTKKVEEFLNKYQREDEEILKQLDNVIIDTQEELSEDQKDKYENLMRKQYRNLTYTIKEEMIDGDNATVTTEIEVYDYRKALNEAEDYYVKNSDEFISSNGELDNTKYMDYKIEKLNSTNETIKYTLTFTLIKIDKEWTLNNTTDIDIQKLHGLYDS